MEKHSPEDAAFRAWRQRAGHAFDHNTIDSGHVHFGDVINFTGKGDAAGNLRRDRAFSKHGDEQLHSSLAGSTDFNKLYMVPRCSTPQFTGRKLQAAMLEEELGRPETALGEHRHKIAVIYGLGGSGKTQFCLRYVESHRSR